MKVNKNIFIEILKILREDGIIDDFNYYEKENVIKIYFDNFLERPIYHFDNNDNLIHPQIYEIKKEIKKLEKERENLENKLKLLTENK